ncbi:hypothetical protein HPB52_000760 [Rhipicephalus sanguineus]|uniref:Uncharacterized protein n=1 Tax=Rhipicephalus sanguineus TaxID=34632 RepID=A0A9D4PEY1_RHISA|nr:hypothetical protein HPB52_000760 [Rhipicephalus sanguineus]
MQTYKVRVVAVPTETPENLSVSCSRASSSRIDRTYASPGLMGFVREAEIMSLPPTPVYISDHRPVKLTLHLPAGTPTAQKPWRLDCRVLQDFQSTQGLSQALRASLVGADISDWDRLKEQWRHHCSASGRALRARVSKDASPTVIRTPPPRYGHGKRSSLTDTNVSCALLRSRLRHGAVGARRVRTLRCLGMHVELYSVRQAHLPIHSILPHHL